MRSIISEHSFRSTPIEESRARREPALLATGVLGVLLAGVCAIVIVVRGSTLIPPEGDLLKPLTFDLAIGIWVVTLAVLVPFSGAGARARMIWRAAMVIGILYFYFAETVPTLYGYDPRFSNVRDNPFGNLVSPLFGFDSALIIVLFGFFAFWFYRRNGNAEHVRLRLGVRWAAIASFVAFGVGIWMIVMGGRSVGLSGSALWPHAFGFHALQAVPVVGWLADESRDTRWPVHAAGALWSLATVGLLIQTAGGGAPFGPSLATVLAATALIGWGAVFSRALLRWYRL